MVKLKRVYESSLFTEAQKDLDDLKDHLGDDLYNDYMKIRNKIPKDQNDYKDFQKLKKLPIEDVKDFVDNFQSESDKRKEAKKGAKKIYSDSDWDIYKITTYPAAQFYGSGTKWCITGRYPGHEGKGKGYFDDYIKNNNLDGGYYFCLDKHNSSRKYCVLRFSKGGIHSIWIPEDSEIQDVDPNDVPEDLPEDVPYSGFNLGEEIQEYIRDNGGSNYDPMEGLARELGKDVDSMDLSKIADLADLVGDYALEDLDYYYDCLFQGDGAIDSKEDAFIILLNEEVPTEEWISKNNIEEKCLENLIDVVLDNPSLYEDSYFDTLFFKIVNNYGKNTKNYGFVQDPRIVFGLLDNCYEEELSRYDIDSDVFENILNAFDNKIILSDAFLKTCFDHGMEWNDFIGYLDDLSDENKDLRIPLLKKGIELGLVDLNELGEISSYRGKITPFMLLLTWDPSVEDVKWMLSHGADPKVKDGSGDTAIEWTDDSKIKELLLK